MCGIVCAFETKNDSLLRPKVLEMAKKIRHRGPGPSQLTPESSSIEWSRTLVNFWGEKSTSIVS